MTRSKTAALASLLAVAAIAAGCGSSSSGGGSDNPIVAPKVKSAVKQCLQQAKQLPQADARKTAEAACNAAKSGNTGKVKSAAKQECLNAVKQIPASAKAQKDAARKRCEAIK